MEINKSVCWVTGAARGIGHNTAIELALAGATVYACDRDAEGLETMADIASDRRLNLLTAVCDITNASQVAALASRIVSEQGQLDVLVNNAGITRDGLLIKVRDGQVQRLPLQDFRAVIDVNLAGVFLCAREAAACMAVRNGGVIINLSSISRAGNVGQTNYSAAKAGVDAMTVTWSKELARHHVRVAAIAPGYVNTEMVRAIKPAVREAIIERIPRRRLGDMSEIAHAVRFVIENDYINGRILEIDGGLRL